MGFFSRRDKDGYDKEGHNKRGFNIDGIFKSTGTRFDDDGYDKDSFDKDGIHKLTGTKYGENGFDKDGYYRDGYDKYGFDKDDNRLWGDFIRRYNIYGFDRDGYDKYGFDKDGYYRDGYDKNGDDVDGKYNGISLQIFYDVEKKKNATSNVGSEGIEEKLRLAAIDEEIKENLVNIWMTYYEIDVENELKRAGRLTDHDIYDEMGYSLQIRVEKKEEYLIEKIISIIKLTFPKMSIFATNLEIFASASDEYQNYDEEYSGRIIKTITQRLGEEFEKLGEVKIIGTKYAPDGYDINSCHPTTSAESKKAYRQIGYNKDGIDKNGFTTSGIHQTTGTKYDLDGNDQHGFDKKGIHKVTGTKFDKEGFDSDGIHKVTKTKFDEDGYDKDGYWEHDKIHEKLEENE